MQGFIIFDHVAEFPEARRVLGEWVRDGKIKGTETIIKGGLDSAQQTLKDLYAGINTGKLIVEIKEA